MNILLFVKAPVAGRVKTRLVPALEPEQAAKLYHAMAKDTLAVAQRVFGERCLIAYEPHADYPKPDWMCRYTSWFVQQGHTLGERLIHATAEVYRRHASPFLVIGTDLPGLTPEVLETAKSMLRDRDVVIGPSADGGYYLIGLKHTRHQLFEQIPWSTSRVLSATLDKLKRTELTCAQLPVMHDLDRPEDLQRLLSNPRELSPDFNHTKEALHACNTL